MVDFNKRGEENARIMLDNKYGRGNWKPGPGSEFSKIVKWLTRDLGLKSFIALNLLDDVNRVFILEGDLIIMDPSGKGFGWINGVYYKRLD